MNLKELIKRDSDYTIAALLHLFGGEKEFKCTEAKILKMLAGQYENSGFLSPQQLSAISRILPKYSKHLEGVDLVKPDSEPAIKRGFDKYAWLDGNLIRLKSNDPADAIRTKQLFNRRYSAKNDSYSCQITLDNLILLKEWGYRLEKDLRRIQRKYMRKASSILESIEIEGLPGTLREYQKEGVTFVKMKDGRALIGDEMGVGKTIQALAYCHVEKESRPLLIVTTGASKLNWKKECEIWLPGESIFICYGKKPDIKKIDSDIIIINYDILKAWKKILSASGIQIVVGDEIHYVKNPTAARSKAFCEIGAGIDKILAMSGTPFDNRPIELFSILNLLAPWLFPSYWDYAKRYCGAYEGQFGWDVNGSSNMDELYDKLGHIMIRRKKKDVLKELPEKIRTVVPIEFDDRIYQKGLADFKAWASREWKKDEDDSMLYYEENPAATMVQLEKLKLAAAKSKMPAAIGWIQDYLENEDKLVIFCNHREIQEALLKKFGSIAVSSKDKDSVYKFQRCSRCGIVQDKHDTDPNACESYIPDLSTRLFIGGKDACEAITLTAASSTCTIEFWWVWAKHEQAEDRVHRIGQKNDSVNAFYLIADGTVESNNIKLLDKKRKISEQALDGIVTKKDDLLAGLLNSILDED